MEAKEAIKILDDFQCDIDYAAEFRGPLSFAIDEAKDALEKQVPKKPKVDKEGRLMCPSCGHGDDCLMFDSNYVYDFCTECGQKIDWSEPVDTSLYEGL